MRPLVWALLLACATVAQAQTTPEGLGWLSKIYQATEKLSYSGTFVYQHGESSETSRIVRLVDASGDLEKLEALDGTPREVLRSREGVRCYLPESRTVKIDRRSGRRSFPAMLPEQLSKVAQNYTVTLGANKRIAGYECQEVVLTPKDDLRYGYKLWADTKTGMLLKARTFDEKGRMVEQFTFTMLAIGNVSPDSLKPRYAAQGWRIEDTTVSPANLAESGWSVRGVLPGFQKVDEVKRSLGDAKPVGQVVYSDGLAAVSVFIEPSDGRAEPVRAGLSNMGAIHIYTREVANHVVTVVGEAPAASIRRIANAVEYRPRQ